MSIDLDHTGREGRAAPPPEPPTRPSRRLKAWRAACVVSVLAMVAAAFLFARIRNDPSIVLVYSRGGADWIRMPEAPRLLQRDLGDYQTSFRTRFTLAAVPPVANLEFRAHLDAEVYINSQRVANTRRTDHRWKETRIVDLAPELRPGTNTIQIEVHARNAPRLLWASAPALSLRSNAHWEASNDGQTWAPALPASVAISTEVSKSFLKPSEGLLTILPILGPLFVLVWLLHYVPRQRYDQLNIARVFTASRVRWAILMAWVVLAGNNILKVPPWVGFDVPGHLEYIQYIYRFHRLPLAHEGWQTFQSPLYYVLSVLPYAAFVRMTHQDGVIQLLRFLPLLCGIAQVEICYRAGRRVYPNRRDMQVVCTALGGLLPMNLYISQYIGNEPLAACLSALVLLWCIYTLTASSPRLETKAIIGLAVLLGCAILAKVTAVLLLAPVCIVVYYRSGQLAINRRWKNVFQFLAVVAVVSGWYFLRNWLEYGKPFVGGWDAARGIIWWQDPGFRTPTQLAGFGAALTQPITAATAGLWDGLYSTFWLDGLLSSNFKHGYHPPWNYSYVVAGAWLAVLPTLAMLVGVGSVFTSTNPARQRVLAFALGCIAVYFAAFAYLYLTLPVYSTGKATYTLGLAPAYALLGTCGMDVFGKRRVGRAVSRACFACWAVSAYAAYFVL